MNTASVASPIVDSRRHDLDALRAVAMLLGIVLHALLSFMPAPWPVQDSRQSDAYALFFVMIHGFRMPLFFVLSGFFTAMLWRGRGLKSLMAHRFKRVLIPLLIGCFTLAPLVSWVSESAMAHPGGGTEGRPADDIWAAARSGDVVVLVDFLDSGVAVDERDGAGNTPLLNAAAMGKLETSRVLLERGADVNALNRDQSTALHLAVFFGYPELVQVLVDAGADLELRNKYGAKPIDNAKVDWSLTKFVMDLFKMEIDRETLEAGRIEAIKMLGGDGAELTEPKAGDSSGGVLLDLMMVPRLHHLWFLSFLIWLVVMFAGYAAIMNRFKWKGVPSWLIISPFRYLWVVPLVMVPQYFMGKIIPIFGPDTSAGWLPLPHVLLYYFIFFMFGALYFDADDKEARLGKRWGITLPLAIFVVLPTGLLFTFGSKFFSGKLDPTVIRFISVFCQVMFAWLMIFGCMGLFRRVVKQANRKVRYLSDSAYWLYLAHLPLVIWGQSLVKDWPVPSAVKFVLLCIVVTAFLLLVYRYAVRYTFVGTMLNGKRVKGV